MSVQSAGSRPSAPRSTQQLCAVITTGPVLGLWAELVSGTMSKISQRGIGLLFADAKEGVTAAVRAAAQSHKGRLLCFALSPNHGELRWACAAAHLLRVKTVVYCLGFPAWQLEDPGDGVWKFDPSCVPSGFRSDVQCAIWEPGEGDPTVNEQALYDMLRAEEWEKEEWGKVEAEDQARVQAQPWRVAA